MEIQRLFSHTWKNITKESDRRKKALGLLKERKEINARVEDLKKTRDADLKKAMKGELVAKDGKKLNSKAVLSRFESDMADVNAYRSSIQDTKHRTPKKTVQNKEVESGVKKLIGRGKEILKSPEAKKGGKVGLIGLGALGVGAAAIKTGRKIKEKRKENEVRKKFKS